MICDICGEEYKYDIENTPNIEIHDEMNHSDPVRKEDHPFKIMADQQTLGVVKEIIKEANKDDL
jgi:hypothetical protein